jgi:chemotaxis methyl-accepting protein methylase
MALQMHGREAASRESWCELIRRRCGLAFRTAQVPAVLDCVRQLVEARGTAERAYYEQLVAAADNDPEWLSLVEHLVNHETSFFRHPPSFDVLRHRVLPDLRSSRGRNRLHLLSAGCSTGQEAYSMAMVAMDDDAGADFAVWGCDISREAIEAARRGRFGRRAIAGVPPAYRQRFVVACGNDTTAEYEICDELRRRVRFSAMNLYVADAGVALSYDVIFCQNVLIYMSAAAVSQIVMHLAARLVPGGYLILGPGEGPTERPALLEPVTMSGVRMFRRKSHAQLEGRQ